MAARPTLSVGVSSLPEIKSLNESSQGVSGRIKSPMNLFRENALAHKRIEALNQHPFDCQK